MSHLNAKKRLCKILEASGYSAIQSEVKQPQTVLQFLGKRNYVADVESSYKGRQYIFEIDGKKGHSTKWNCSKDKARNRSLLAIGKFTIRIPTGYLVGKGKISDREILEEIDYQTKQLT